VACEKKPPRDPKRKKKGGATKNHPAGGGGKGRKVPRTGSAEGARLIKKKGRLYQRKEKKGPRGYPFRAPISFEWGR